MLTGAETLSTIDRALRQVRAEMQSIDEQIAVLTNQIGELRQQRAARCVALAKLRLEQISRGSLVEEMDAADREASKLLTERENEIRQIQTALADANRDEEAARTRRAALANEVESMARRLDELEARVQQQLKADPHYVELDHRAKDAHHTAVGAEEKATHAEQDRIGKGKPYENEPLFMYLWERKFGTTQYRSAGLTRVLDAWVAKLCGYADARPNYAMMIEIPVRLREHATTLREYANREATALEATERAALEAAGATDATKELDDARQKLASADAELAAIAERQRDLLGRQNAFAEGRDNTFARALNVLSAQIEREDIRRLSYEARLTRTNEDNVIVEEIAQLDKQEAGLRELVAQQRGTHAARLTRLSELEKIRAEFTARQYDDIHSQFPQGAVIGSVLEEFLRGMANAQQVWRTIGGAHQRRRVGADPGFGSGGLGRPTSPWRVPTPLPRPVQVPTGPPSPHGTGRKQNGRPGFRTAGGF